MAKTAALTNGVASGHHLHESTSSLHSEDSASTACSCGCASETSGRSNVSLETTGIPATSVTASPPTHDALLHQSRPCCGGRPGDDCNRRWSRSSATGYNDIGGSSAIQGNDDNRRPADNERPVDNGIPTVNGRTTDNRTSNESPRSRRTLRLGPRRGPFIALYMPRTGRLGGRRHGVTKAFIRALSLTFFELMPWMMGLVAIYYAFKMWGLGPGFSAFLLMMGIHACLRWRKAQSSRDPFCLVSRMRGRSQQQQIPQEEAGDRRPAVQEENEEDRASGGEGHDSVEPPPYDMVITKPPPYELLFNFQTQSCLEPCPKNVQGIRAPCSTPSLLPGATTSTDDEVREEDAFLPSYTDAVVISARQNR
ncbi:uncharacterized protein LOC143038751 [Oratosquilla oratoria]|uniref:uncharacterized protein LOC143038751 n=1 Tax=Oratosquilla oratoria TaxID=337810 RepID=UPI003F777E60